MSGTEPALLIGGELRTATSQPRTDIVNPCTEEILWTSPSAGPDDVAEALAHADALSRGLQAGMVGINTFMIAHAEAPFGGINHSGMGREGGRQAIHDYLNVKMTHFMAA